MVKRLESIQNFKYVSNTIYVILLLIELKDVIFCSQKVTKLMVNLFVYLFLNDFANLVGVVNVAGKGWAYNVSLFVHNLDDMRPDLVRLVLNDGRVRPVIDVQVKELSWIFLSSWLHKNFINSGKTH